MKKRTATRSSEGTSVYGVVQPEEWMASATCASLPHEVTDVLFFPGEDKEAHHTYQEAAYEMCRACPVQLKCQAYGLRLAGEMQLYGMFGGLTGTERARLRRGERTGTPQGEAHGSARMTDRDVRLIRRLWDEGLLSQAEIAAMVGVSRHAVRRVTSGAGWTHVA